ncbi:MAG: hypothetical protein AB1450_13345 [Pseudomonadota bacterium]
MASDMVLESRPEMAVYRVDGGRFLCTFEAVKGVTYAGRGNTPRLAIAAALFAYGITLDLDLLQNPPDVD